MKELSQNEVRVEIGENDNGAGRYSDCRRGCSLNCCTNQIWKSLGKVQSTALNQKSSQSRNSMGCHHGHDPLVHHSWRMLEAYPAHSCRVRAASSITHLRPNGLSSAIRNRLCAKLRWIVSKNGKLSVIRNYPIARSNPHSGRADRPAFRVEL